MSCSSAITMPPSTSPCPAIYLVALWTTMFAPSSSGRTSSGVAKVLSTISGAPASLRDRGDLIHRADAQQRIRDGLHEDRAGFGFGDRLLRNAARSQMSASVDFDARAAQGYSSACWSWRRRERWPRPRACGRSSSAASNARCNAPSRKRTRRRRARLRASFTSSSSALRGGIAVARVGRALLLRARRRDRAGSIES